MSHSDTIPLHPSSQSDIDEIENLMNSSYPTSVLPARPSSPPRASIPVSSAPPTPIPPPAFIPSNLPPPSAPKPTPTASKPPIPPAPGSTSSGFGPAPNTLTEPVWDTVKRDLSRIVSNLKLVVFPNPFREDPGKALRDWDLWGPFFFIVFLGLTLSWSASVKKTMKPTSSFTLSCFFFIIFLSLLASLNEIRFGSLLKFHQCAFTQTNEVENLHDASSISAVSPNDEIRILLGILTLPDQYHKRHFLRLVYGTQSPIGARVDVKFVFCNLTKEDQKVLVALEIMRYNDIIILDCQENMNKGKTYTFFSSLSEMFNDTNTSYPPYHYVMKGDDDIYIRLQNLVDSLVPLSRQDLYYGFVIPCESMDPFVLYMSGMGYLVSWDIVEWLKDSDIPKRHLEGSEDRLFGEWIREGRRGKNRHNAKWSMYNYPEPPTKCSHELWPDTIAVHLLKNQEKWIRTLQYFNVTQSLKPSKLYHIP